LSGVRRLPLNTFMPISLHRLGSLTVVATLVAILAACSGSGAGDRPPEPGDTVVARVEDRNVWASDVKREAVAQGLMGEEEPLELSSDLFRRVLDEVVDQKLLAREAERRGLDRSALAQRRLAASRERILGDMLVENEVNTRVNDQKVAALYQRQLRIAQTTEEIRVRLILSRTRLEADGVIGILAQGAAFSAVATERSIDEATRFSGGDLGYSTLDVMPQAYSDALRGVSSGATAGPIQTEGGWAVLKVEDRRKESPPTLEQARPQIVRYLTYDGVRDLLAQLRGKAEVEILLPPASTGRMDAAPPRAGTAQPPTGASAGPPPGAAVQGQRQ